MFTIDATARRIAAVAVTAAHTLRSKRTASGTFFVGLLAGAGLTAGLHQGNSIQAILCRNTQPDLVLAFTLYPVTAPAGQLSVIALAVAFLMSVLLWSKRTTSDSFFLGVLAGMGFVLSVDIVLIHWIFGLHHITNTQMDLVLEPLFVVLGLVFLWFAITRERGQANRATQ
jgi:phage shock protein PspC (stress-responsive transcriptional regulator)